ncbi:MAG: putative branched-chain-amino-acid aminotransferase, partial [Actinomycetota bacterium]
PDSELARILDEPGFARHPLDHMVRSVYSKGVWSDPEIVPYQPLTFDPATSVLHYGQSIFEGLKAYRQPDDSVALFRPERNAARFNRSAVRLAMPELPEEYFVHGVEALVDLERRWVPDHPERSLYIRPFMLGTDIALGVRPSSEYLFLVIASPAGAYFANGVQPVTVWISEDYVRAAPGGTGEAKCAGNYAASLIAQAEASDHGCDQVVWLDASERLWIEEMGGMNLFFVYGSGAGARLLTPELTGSLLPGVTRESLLVLAADLGYDVGEGRISRDEWREGCASGEITETFACGTAAVITPVGSVRSHTHAWDVGDGSPGPVAMQLRQSLLDIQTGRAPDRHGWVRRLG